MSENSHQSFLELEVWKKSRELKNEIFTLVKDFPSEEKFRLADQLIRCTRAMNSNTSEGHGRFSFKDQIHFCIPARGCLSETYNHLIDALHCWYISHEQLGYYKTKIDDVGRLFNGYTTYLRKNI